MTHTIKTGAFETSEAKQLMETALPFMQEGNFLKAAEHIQRALNIEPASNKLWYVFGVCMSETGNDQEALSAFEKAEELHFNNPDLLARKAQCLMNFNAFDKAMAALNKAISVDPKFSEAHFKLGALHSIQGNQKKALRSYEKTLELLPGNPITLYNIASIKNLPEKYRPYFSPRHKAHRHLSSTSLDYSYVYFANAIRQNKQEKYEDAFLSFTKANGIVRKKVPFDKASLSRRTDKHLISFNHALSNQAPPPQYSS